MVSELQAKEAAAATGRQGEQGTSTTVEFNVDGAVISVSVDKSRCGPDAAAAVEKAREAVAQLAKAQKREARKSAQPKRPNECPNTFATWAYRGY